MSEKEFTLDSILNNIESQELYTILDEEIDVSMLSDDSSMLSDDSSEVDDEIKIDIEIKKSEKERLEKIANLFNEGLEEKQTVKKVIKTKEQKIPGDACVQLFIENNWQIGLLGESITSFPKYQDGWKRFSKLKIFEKLNQDLLYVCNEDGTLDFIYRKSDDSVIFSASDKVLQRAKRIPMAKKEKAPKAKRVIKVKAPKAKKTEPKKKVTTKKESEFTQVVHCKFRSETGHWVLYAEEKANPQNLIEIRKFNVLAYVLAAWRGRSARIVEAKQDTCHVWKEDGSEIDYTLIRGVQEYKPKETKSAKTKKAAEPKTFEVKKDDGQIVEVKVKKNYGCKPIPVLVRGTKKLEGERKEGMIIEKNPRLITVQFCSFISKSLDYTQQFDAKTGELMSSNPYQGWKIDFDSIQSA